MSARTYGKRGAKRKLNSDPNSEISSPKRPKIDSTEQPATPKAARDLSHIFDTALSASAPSTPTKLAQRMLGRSKTESSLENSRDSPSFSSKNLLDRTSSMPSFVSPTKSPLSSPTTARAIEPSSSPQRPAMVNKRTYAGKSRSFLVAMTADHSLPEELQDDYNSRESYAALRSRWGVDNSEDDPYPEPEIPSPSKSVTSTPNSSPSKGKNKGRLKQEANSPNGVIKPLRSITEIRNKGESRRFLDEVGYLLEGMGKDETPALRKASALEIISRLCEPDFIRQAKAADFLQSTWDAFIEAGGGTGEDKVLDTLLVVFAALVSRDAVSLTDLAQRDYSPSSSTSSQSSFTSTLFSLVASLSPETDPLMIVSQSLTPDSPLKKLGIMKTDRAVLKTLHSTFTSQARMFSSKTLISNAFLLTHTLTTIPTELLSHTHVLHLLRSLHAQLQPAISSINNLPNVDSEYHNSTPSSSKATPVASSSTVLTTLRPIPFPVIHGLLSLLDSYLLAQWAPSRKPDQEKSRRFLDKARDEWLADGLLAVGISAELLAGKENKRRTGSRCTEIVFRVLVSLTHSDSLWGQSLTKSSQAIIFIVRTIIRAGNLWGKNVTDDYDKLTDHVSSEESENGRVDQPTKATERLQARALDWLCLSLGLLTNLVQVVEEAKTTVRNTKLDPNCIHKPLPCIHVCSCHNRMSVLDILVTTYKHQLPIIAPAVKTETHSSDTPLALELEQQQEAEADASFLLGHLSVLFGLLMMDSPENQEIVLDALPLLHSNHDDSKPSKSKQQKLAQLAENASELGVFYAVIS
ncbi:hypothetical protein GGU11DRAFT_859097, partial [Lentinula aff. detonsa]